VLSDVDGKYYHTYPEAQILAGDSLMTALKSYAPSIEDVIGHHDIAPERKLDPGPEFPFAHYRALLLGRA
jgi:N-acetyl-anhydromuramyl-L-alanine amidase AmpD